MAVLSGGAALRESTTVDEITHIGSGLSYLQKLDLRMNPEHPPLPKALAAIPLVLRGVRADYQHISWTHSQKFFASELGEWVFGEAVLDRWNRPESVLAWARLPMLALSLTLGWAIFGLARRLGGTWGGLLCLCLYVTTPAFLAFAPLVHTDMAVTLFCLLTLWTFAGVWREPNQRSIWLFALSLAGALLSKFNAGVLFLAFPAFALSLRWRVVSGQPVNKADMRQWRRIRWHATLRGIFWAALVVYLFYLVFSWNQPSTALHKIGNGPAALVLRRLLMPPVLYLRGLFWVLISGVRPTFILGRTYRHGVWFYFPVVFALKSALGFLGLLFFAAVVSLTRKVRRATVCVIPEDLEVHWRALWVGFIVFTAICLLSPMDISIRHFSVPMVLLIVLIAPWPRMIAEWHQTTYWRTAAVLLIALLLANCVFTAVRTYPYYFSYVNALGMGHPAYTLMNDSNVDWNQSLPEVRRFAAEHGLSRIRVDAYALASPQPFVPQAQLWNCQKPQPQDAGQWAVVSANFILDGQNCAWLMHYPHEALAHGSMYAVQLPIPIPEAGTAGGPPLPSQFRYIGGALFDVQAIQLHVQEQPEDLPRATEWMSNLFQLFQKAHFQPIQIPKLPWEE